MQFQCDLGNAIWATRSGHLTFILCVVCSQGEFSSWSLVPD